MNASITAYSAHDDSLSVSIRSTNEAVPNIEVSVSFSRWNDSGWQAPNYRMSSTGSAGLDSMMDLRNAMLLAENAGAYMEALVSAFDGPLEGSDHMNANELLCGFVNDNR